MSDAVKKATTKLEFPVSRRAEVTVIQMDTVAFLDAQYTIVPEREDAMLSDNGKKIAFWVYTRTPEVEAAIAEWNTRERMSTKLIFSFREKQLYYRQRKARLERR